MDKVKKGFYKGLVCRKCNTLHRDGIYQKCPTCGSSAASFLVADYDYGLLEEYKFERMINVSDNSIWRYKDFLPVVDKANIISLGEGFTPIILCENLGEKYGTEKLYMLNEGMNPTHSFKDRGVSVFVSKAIEFNVTTLAVSSAGNLGTAVAAYAAKARKKCFVIIPANTRFERLCQLMVFHPQLLPLGDSVDDVHKFSSNVYERFGWSDINWALRPFYMEGMKTIAFEISEKFHWRPPDWVIVPTGSGASITAIWKGFRDLKKVGLLKSTPRMVAVQPKGYDPIAKAFLRGKREIIAVNTTVECLATGARIKNPTRHGQSTLTALQESNGYSISVTNREMITAQYELSTYEGVFPEITSAMALAGAKKMIQKGIIGDASVLCVISSTGIKETEVLKHHFKKPRRIRLDDFLMSSGSQTLSRSDRDAGKVKGRKL